MGPGRWLSAAQWLAVFLLLLLARPAQAQNEPVTEAAYWLLLAETEAALAEAPVDPVELNELAGRWSAINLIQLADGQRQVVDGAYLAAALTDPETDLAALREQLAAMGRQADAVTSGAATANRDELTAVLSDNRFNYEEQEPNLLQRLQNWFLNGLNQLLARLFGGAASLQIGNLLTLLLVPVLLVVLALVVRAVLRDFVSEAELAEALEREQILTADSALSQAQNHSQEGDYRTAVRYLYLSCLLSLEERGLLRYDRSLTNREYLRSVAHVPELAGVLQDVVNIFDRVWYGYQPITPETYDRYAAQVQALRRRS
ncbi:MAG: DUF4129 domain-containing protein [Anaerolineales bacterium]|nr:DUF4129 domain-containing protein [Anaerolineales bacterium]